MKKYINYENASIDVTQYVAKELNKNEYLKNPKIKNLDIIEKSLITYSKLKLEEWEKYDDDYKSYNLEELSKTIDKFCESSFEGYLYPTNSTPVQIKGKRPYYVWVLGSKYLIGALNKQEIEIEWGKETLDNDAVIIRRSDEIKAIITNEKLLPYQVPSTIIKEYRKNLLEKEKVLNK